MNVLDRQADYDRIKEIHGVELHQCSEIIAERHWDNGVIVNTVYTWESPQYDYALVTADCGIHMESVIQQLNLEILDYYPNINCFLLKKK